MGLNKLKWALDYVRGEVDSERENSFYLIDHWGRNCLCLSGPSVTVANGLAQDSVFVSGQEWADPCLQEAPRDEGTVGGYFALLCFGFRCQGEVVVSVLSDIDSLVAPSGRTTARTRGVDVTVVVMARLERRFDGDCVARFKQ